MASAGRTSFAIDVATADEPYWLTFSQSWNPGWTASVAGQDLGTPQVINGYANGWLIDPAALGIAPGTTVRVDVTWAPQRVVWVAVGLSLVALVVCIALLLFARRRPEPVVDTGGVDRRVGGLDPRLVRPTWFGSSRTRPGRATSTRAAVLAGAGFGAALLLNAPTTPANLALALPVGLAVGVAWRWRRGRGALGLLAAASLGAAGAYHVVWQWRFAFPADFVWPQLFERVDVLGVAAVVLLVAEAARELAARELGPDADTA